MASQPPEASASRSAASVATRIESTAIPACSSTPVIRRASPASFSTRMRRSGFTWVSVPEWSPPADFSVHAPARPGQCQNAHFDPTQSGMPGYPFCVRRNSRTRASYKKRLSLRGAHERSHRERNFDRSVEVVQGKRLRKVGERTEGEEARLGRQDADADHRDRRLALPHDARLLEAGGRRRLEQEKIARR